jgi:hypothetical protein
MRPPPRRLFRDRRQAAAIGGNYVRPILAAAAKHAVPGELLELATLHDGWCRFLAGRGPCNCRPIIKTLADHQRSVAERN